jgi:hypothetical protein
MSNTHDCPTLIAVVGAVLLTVTHEIRADTLTIVTLKRACVAACCASVCLRSVRAHIRANVVVDTVVVVVLQMHITLLDTQVTL